MAVWTKVRTVTAVLSGGVLGAVLLTAGCNDDSSREASAAAMQAATPTGVPATLPSTRKHIYPEVGSAQADVRAAFQEAKKTHKRVLLDFGGDWCGDCQVLDIYFGQAENAELLAKYFVKVNVNIGRQDANLDIAKKYGVPVHGVPALAVVDANGKVIVSQDKEFSSMRNMQSSSVTDFLNKWKQ